MSCNEVHIGDIGTSFLATIKNENDVVEDISSASSLVMKFVKPDGEELTVNATFYTDGTDGKMVYQSVSGDLDQTGLWQMQGTVVIDSGTFHTSIHKFDVVENL